MQDPRTLLRKEVEGAGGAVAFAERIGCSSEYVYMMMDGTRTPSRKMARKIEAASAKRLKRQYWDMAA